MSEETVFSDRRKPLSRKTLSPGRALCLGFLALILAGGLLLTLPAASADGTSLGLLKGMFTATSAVCVTGLSLIEAGRDLSLFGQIVLLCLIQVGGLGFMAFATLGMVLIGRRISLHSRILLSESMNQNGLSGLQSTISYLTNAGIDHAGTYADAAERAANNGVVIKNVSGLKVAIIAYTKGLGGLQLPEGAEYAVNLLYKDYSTDYEKLDTQALLQSVDAAKELKPDVILVMLHWGSEATLEVTKTQQSLAKQLFERGADAILGTHSHLVGKMETMDVTTDDGEDKTCFVAYSLGNFFSSQDSSYASGCESSVILNLQFTKNGETGETALTSVNYTPLYLMDRGSGADGAQYEILPIRTAIASGLFPDDTQTLTDAISRLRTRTESDFDSGK